MFEDMNSKTTALLMLSIMCFIGLLLPFPLAPVTFFTSIAILILARKEYHRALLEGYSEGIVYKLCFTMTACLGNMVATVCFVLLICVGLVVAIPAMIQDIQNREKRPRSAKTEINIKEFNQYNY